MRRLNKVFFVSAYTSTFVQQDLEILSKHFKVRTLFLPKANKKSPFYMLYSYFVIFLGVLNSDITYAVFADLRAYFSVFWSRLLGKKIIVSVGGYESACLPEINYGGMLKSGQANRFRYILKHADRILTNSEFSKQEVLTVGPAAKITAVYLGITKDPIPVLPKEDLMITIGEATEDFWRLKGLDIFARAAISFPNLKSIIIGKYDEKIKKHLLQINPELEFTGYIKNEKLLELLAKAKIYCQLSMRESFGYSVLEAMKNGAIPVVANTGSLPEVVGDTGFLSIYGDVESTVYNIKQALIKGSAERVKERAENVFTIENREKSFLDILEKV